MRRLLSSITGVSDPFGVTDQLVFTAAPPPNVKVGQPFSARVEAQDGNGVLDTSFEGKVTLSDHYSDYYSGSLDGTLTVNAIDGVATFTGISQEMPTSQTDWAEGDKLFANSGKLPQGVSAPFNLYTDRLAFLTQPPAQVTAGAPISVEVEALDGDGNLDTAFVGKVTMSNRYWFESSGLQGDLTVKAVGGIATFSDITDTVATTPDLGQDSLYAYGFWEGMPNAYSNPFTVNPAQASQLVFTNAPSDANSGDFILTNKALSVEVTAEDQYGNVATGFNGDISLDLGRNRGGATLGGTTTLTARHGIATFDDITISAAGHGYTLVASGAGTAMSDPFDVSDQLVFTAQPPGHVNTGAAFTVVVEAEDGAGKLDSSFHGAVTLSDLYGDDYDAPLDGRLSVDAVNGVATFTDISQAFATQKTDGSSPDRLQAESEGMISASSNYFAVVDQNADVLVFAPPPPASVVVNSPFSVVVNVDKAAGQLDTSFNGIITLHDRYYDDFEPAYLIGTLSVKAVNGVASFSGIYENFSTAETDNGELDVLYARSPDAAPATSGGFSVNAANQFVFTAQPPESVNAGEKFSVTVTAEDASGNVDSSFNGPITLSDQYSSEYAGAPLGGTLSVNAVNGVAKFSDVYQTYSSAFASNNDQDLLFASGDGFATGASDTFRVQGSANSQQVAFMVQPPASIAAGATFSVSIAAHDSAGNLLSSFNGSITLSASDNSNLKGTLTEQAADGVAVFNDLSITDASTTDGGIYLIASTNDQEGDSDNFVVTPGAVTQLDFSAMPVDAGDNSNNALVNSPLTLTVQAEDQYGNVVSSFDGSITLKIGSGPAGAVFGGTTTLAAAGGIATFKDITLDTRGDYTLVASGPATTTSDSFTVSDQLVFLTQPPKLLRPGEPFTVVVKAEDGLGVVDSRVSGDVTLAYAYAYGSYGSYGYNSGTYGYDYPLDGTTTVKAVGGIATFSSASVPVTANDIVLVADGDDLVQGASSEFSVQADQLVFTTAPQAATAGQAFDVVVEADSPGGGIDTSFNGSVTISDDYSGNFGDASQLKGTLTVNAKDGVATFTGISQNTASSTAGYDDELYADANGLNGGYSDSFTIAAAAAAKLAFVGVPTDTNGDGGTVANSKLSVRVVAQDAYGNANSNFSGMIAIALRTNPTGASLGGTTTVAITSGIADFTDLTISAVGDGYTLIATAVSGDTTAAADKLTPMRIAAH
jgi:hypothetical protein